MDANVFATRIPKHFDLVYLDPPYNQHPYASNYFMLNTIVDSRLGKDLSRISGIPADWNRSDYNKKDKIKKSLTELISNLDASYVVISYNNTGFITKKQMINMLKEHGDVTIKTIPYHSYCYKSRKKTGINNAVEEYLFVLHKNIQQISDAA